MTVLTRRSGECIRIGPAIELRVLAIQDSRVKLALAERLRRPCVLAQSARPRGYYLFRKGEGRSLVLHRRAGQKIRLDPAVELAMLAIHDGQVTLGVDSGTDAI